VTGFTIPGVNDSGVGTMLRDWRQRRRRTQLDLALDAGISTRHLSFLETGRSRPSAEMLLTLSEHLELPLRERNRLLLAAGFAPRYQQRELDSPELAAVRDAIGHVLTGHEPYPAFVVDPIWNMVASNAALAVLLEDVAPELLHPPVNVMRVALHPEGLAPRILNLAEYRGRLLARLTRDVQLHGDPRVQELLEEVSGYPGPDIAAGHNGYDVAAITMQLHLASSFGELRLFSTIAAFGTALDVTVAELSLEAFFPADPETAEALRNAAGT